MTLKAPYRSSAFGMLARNSEGCLGLARCGVGWEMCSLQPIACLWPIGSAWISVHVSPFCSSSELDICEENRKRGRRDKIVK